MTDWDITTEEYYMYQEELDELFEALNEHW